MENKKSNRLKHVQRVAEMRTQNRIRQMYEFRAEKDEKALDEYEAVKKAQKAKEDRKAAEKAASAKAKKD